MAAFLTIWCRLLRRTTGKIFQNFNFLTSRDLSLLPQNIAVIKTLLLFEAGLFFFGFSVEERHATGFNERESIPKRHF